MEMAKRCLEQAVCGVTVCPTGRVMSHCDGRGVQSRVYAQLGWTPAPPVNFLFLSQHRRPMSQADPAHTSGLPADAVERCTKV